MSHFTMEHHVGVVEVNGILVNREPADTVENVQIPQRNCRLFQLNQIIIIIAIIQNVSSQDEDGTGNPD